MPWISCSFVLGNVSLLKNSFNWCHMFSIGLQSGDSRGVRHQFNPFPLIKVAASIEICFGSLFCMNLCPSGYIAQINGNNAASGIWMNNGAFIMPSTIQILVFPLQLIPAHTCTYFCGMLCLGFIFVSSPTFRQQCLFWDSISMEHSSVQITPWKLSDRLAVAILAPIVNTCKAAMCPGPIH